MPDVDQDERKKEFHRVMVKLYREIVRRSKYHPNYFGEMLDNQRGYDVACDLAGKVQPTPGFLEVVRRGFPELTIEAVILSKEWEGLFPLEVKVNARQHLVDAEYKLPGDSWQP